jgi:hypothetical protein
LSPQLLIADAGDGLAEMLEWLVNYRRIELRTLVIGSVGSFGGQPPVR